MLVEVPPETRPESVSGAVRVHDEGPLGERVRRQFDAAKEPSAVHLHVFCEDTLDEERALEFNRARLADGAPWIWVSSGALARAYVGPVFLPWRGPCFGCLVAAFDRLSPAPEIRARIREEAQRGRALRRAELSEQSLEVVAQTVSFKVGALARTEVPAAAYRLHVLELASFEISTHAVPIDPDCEARCASPRSFERASV
jgi:bacteriocin biosynthesis cyclodehydratase domain-containing protein